MKNDTADKNVVKRRTVLILLVVSAVLCAALCFIFWSAEKANPLPATPAVQRSVMK